MQIPQPKKKLRVLMIAPQPWFQPRGTPFSVLHRIKAMSLLGHSIDLATYHIGEDVPIDNLNIYRSRRVPFIKTIKIGPSKSKILLDAALFFTASGLLKRNRYDLIHTHEEASFFGDYFARKYNIPHLYDMHSSLPQQLSNFKYTKSTWIKKIFEMLEERTIRSAQAVITICPELDQYVESRFPKKTHILIENVADNSIVFPADKVDREKLKSAFHLNGAPVILYYGTFEAYQGLDLLLQSANELINNRHINARFLLIGGDEKQIEKYKALTRQYGLDEHVQFTGFVKPQWIPAFISLARLLVSPRISGTNSPLKLYSYLRSGKPIVATRHITHTQILDDSVSVLVEPKPVDFADGIGYLLQNEEQGRQLAANAQRLAQKKYDYGHFLEKTEWILERAAGATI